MIDPLCPSTERLLYLAGPYTTNEKGDTEEFIATAKTIGTELRRMGWALVIPHCNSLPIDGWCLARYLAEDFRIIRGCDALVILPHWQFSPGTRQEIEFATLRGIPVYDYRTLMPDWKG